MANRFKNLATACSFCAQCFFSKRLEGANLEAGALIYLPEITQGALNALCHVLFASIVTAGREVYATEARNIYRSFKFRSQAVEKQLGEGF
nr:type IVB secretion system protein IcmJDotN [Coxiella-like endosymbiont]